MDVDWHGINPWSGVVGASAFTVAHTVVAVGWPLLQVIDRDPLRQALLLHVQLLRDSWEVAFINHGEVISIPLGSAMIMKTSPSVKVTSGSITPWNFLHSWPGSEVGWVLEGTPPQANAAEALYSQWCVAAGQDGCPGLPTSCPWVAENGAFWWRGVLVGVHGSCPPPLPSCTP